ncbi:MAG: hypothetical protein ACR2HK_06240 [Gemmatimonadales bacterium]
MRSTLAALVAVALLAGCESRADRETGAAENGGAGVDTSVTTTRVQDTTIVAADTTIDVDTLKQTDNVEEAR